MTALAEHPMVSIPLQPEPVAEQQVESLTGTQVLETFSYPDLGYRVEAVAPNDYRVAAAIEIEVDTMAMLGDPPDEVRAEFQPFNPDSLFFLAFPLQSDGQPEDIHAMGRIIGRAPGRTNKTLADLASIPGWDKWGIKPELRRTEVGTIVKAHRERSVIEAFKKETGCKDMDKVWDISTLAPNFKQLGNEIKPGTVATPLIRAFTSTVLEAYRRGEVTHLTAFNEQSAHTFFTETLGFNFNNLFRLKPMVYDSFGTEVGMKAQPAWYDVSRLAQDVLDHSKRFFKGLGITELVEPGDPQSGRWTRFGSVALGYEVWSNVSWPLFMVAGTVLEKHGVSNLDAGTAIGALATAETAVSSVITEHYMGDAPQISSPATGKFRRLKRLVNRSPLAVSAWQGAGHGVMLDKALGKPITARRRLLHSLPYGAGTGALWVGTGVGEWASRVVPEWTLHTVPAEAASYYPEGFGALGAIALAYGVSRLNPWVKYRRQQSALRKELEAEQTQPVATAEVVATEFGIAE